MTERIETLERLQKLRDSGVLTEPEFEREKARLLAPPTGAPAKRPMLLWIAVGALIVVIALLAALLLRPSGAPEEIANRQAGAAQDAPPANGLAAAVPQASIRARTPGEQRTIAFQTAFGRTGRATRDFDGGSFTFTPSGFRWFGDRAVLVSSGRNSEDCHACAGAIAVHYLQAAGDQFTVTGEWLNRIPSGGFGQPSRWRFSNVLSESPMLEVDGGGMWQGIVCSSQAFYSLGTDGPREAAGFLTSMDTSGSGIVESRSLEGRLRNVVKDRSFDVVYSGSERFTEHYELRGGRYVLTTSADSRATC